MQREGKGQSVAEPLEARWRCEPLENAEVCEAYLFTLAGPESEGVVCQVVVPALIIVRSIFGGERLELMVDREEARLMVAGQGFDDDLLDALTDQRLV